MAIVVVQVGQCGNQLGDEFVTQLLITTAKGTISSPFFTPDGKARFVLVDSEPKVVLRMHSRHSNVIRRENVVYGQSGRGNNWGLGYYGVNGPNSLRYEGNGAAKDRAFCNLHKSQRCDDDALLSKTLCAIHKETRRTMECDSFDAIILLHSLSGGTGSGMASRLAEKIRFYFVEPREESTIDEIDEDDMARRDGLDGMMGEKRRAKHLLSITVAPQSAGELATQAINAALTLHVLHRCADAVILLRNDDALTPGDEHSSSVVKGQYSPLRRCVTFKEANEVLTAMLLPLFGYGIGSSSVVDKLLRQCAPKDARLTGGSTFLTLLSTPQQTYESLRRTTTRCCFYKLQGSKVMMPGCVPEIPQHTIMAASAWARMGSPDNSQTRFSGSGGAKCGRDRRSLPTKLRQRMARSRWSDEDDEDEESCSDADTDFATVELVVPRELSMYYERFPRSPLATLSKTMEGVAVLNQARELCASLVFPLLRSAALKIKVGAFLFAYTDVGVSAQRIEQAYRHVAEVLANAEEL